MKKNKRPITMSDGRREVRIYTTKNRGRILYQLSHNFGGPAAESDRRGHVVLHLGHARRAGKGAEFDQSVAEELAEVDHATPTGHGRRFLEAQVGVLLHRLDQVGHVGGKRVAIRVRVPPRPGLAVDRARVPLGNVRQLAGELAALGVIV